MHPGGELISEKPSGRGCYVRGAAAIIDLPITGHQRASSSNTTIIRHTVRSDAMCHAFAAAYEAAIMRSSVSQTTVYDTSYAGYRAAQRQTGSGRCGHGPSHPGIAVT